MAVEKQANPKKKVLPLSKKLEEEEETLAAAEAPAKNNATPAKAAKNGKAMKKKGREDEGEEETPPPPQKGKAAPPESSGPVEVEESGEEDDQNGGRDEEEAPPPKATPIQPHSELTPVVTIPTEEDELDDEDGEAEMDTTLALDAEEKKAGMVKVKEDKEDDRKEGESSKDGFCLFVGNLNKSKGFEEIKEALTIFFSENNLEIQNVRLGSSKKFGHVDFSTEEQLQKALELNGKKVLGQNVRLDKAKHKATPQEARKDGEAEMDTTLALVAEEKKAGMVKVKEDKEDDRKEGESSKDEPALTPGKRKAQPKDGASPAKKPKPESFRLFIGNLNTSKGFEEIKEALTIFFSENNLEIQNVRLGSSKKFGYVDFSTEELLQKALELNGKKVLGKNVRLDKAKHKATPQEARKDGEAEMDTTLALVAEEKKAGMVKVKEDKEDDRKEGESSKDEPALTPGKRKAQPKDGASPAKKPKPESFRLFIGNLNTSKGFEEIKEALTIFFSENNLEIQNVRLGSSKKFGYVDFSTEELLQKALELNGKKVLGKNVRLDKAKHKATPQEARKERDACTLFVKNVPFAATKEDLKQVFTQAIQIRMPTGNTGSNKGIAFMEFKSKAVAEQVLAEKQGADVQGCSVILDFIRDQSQKGFRAPDAASPNKTLMVNNLVYSASEETLQKTFEKAVSIRIPINHGRPTGFAFVEFGKAEDSSEALESLNSVKVGGRPIRLEYCRSQYEKPELGRATGPTKTLFVKGLSKETTEETLKESFEGAVAARVAIAKDTGIPKGFGFVDFDSEEFCKVAREAMEDCAIDGSKVALDYARPRGQGGRGGGGRMAHRGRVVFRGVKGGRGGSRGGFGGRGGGKPRGKKMKRDE